MRNYNAYLERLNKLDSKLELLYYELSGVKGVRYDKLPGSFNKLRADEKKYSLMKEISEVESEITRISLQIDRVDRVLDSIKDIEIRNAIYEIYIEGKRCRDVAEDLYMSHTTLLRKINKALEGK